VPDLANLFDYSDVDAQRDAALHDARRIAALEDRVAWLARHGVTEFAAGLGCGLVYGEQGCAIEDLVWFTDVPGVVGDDEDEAEEGEDA
jgi:hypothetical protein